jgi:flagellar biosynthesis protein FlhF
MKLKSYFSGTVEAAMELARQELGEEALLVNARPSTPETRYLGACEVVFGILPRCVPEAPVIAPESRLAEEVADLKRGFAQLMETLATGRPPPSAMIPAASSDLHTRLLDQDLDPALARAVSEGTPLQDLFEVDPTLGRPGATRAIVALVGPPGSGKTSTLVKLAALFGLTSRKPAQILSTDVFRIAAADQLRSLAAILGIGFDVAETPGALAQLLEEHRSKELIFIDTPGLSHAGMEDAEDLARFLATHPEIDTHLVLPASMRSADLARTIDRYAIFGPRKLLFTRLDETSQFGTLISEARRRSLPLSFLATGQQIPEDLEPAEKSRLVELVVSNINQSDMNHGASSEVEPQMKRATA